MTTLSLIVPTHREDRPLARCLESVAGQLADGDEVIVVGDTLDGALPGVQALVKSYGPQFMYVAKTVGHHCWGHCQVNAAIEQARGDYINVNDDDDVWTPDALAACREVADSHGPHPFLFRFQSYHGPVFWHTRGLVARNHIGGHCLVAPNVPGKVGAFACDYSGDFEWVDSTLAYYGGPNGAVWVDHLIARARP